MSLTDLHDVVRLITFGRVTLYGAIAKYLCDNKEILRVGWALNSSFHFEPKAYAHKVLNRNDILSGAMYFPPDCLIVKNSQLLGC